MYIQSISLCYQTFFYFIENILIQMKPQLSHFVMLKTGYHKKFEKRGPPHDIDRYLGVMSPSGFKIRLLSAEFSRELSSCTS